MAKTTTKKAAPTPAKTTVEETPPVMQTLLAVTKPEETVMLIEKWEDTQLQIDNIMTLLDSFTEVTNDAQMKKLDDAISQGKKLAKEIDDTGLQVRRPYNTIATTTKQFFDGKSGPILTKADEKLTKLLKPYNKKKAEAAQEKARKLQEEENARLAEIEKEKNTLIAWKAKIVAAINSSHTLEEMKTVSDTYLIPFTPDLFPNYRDLAIEYLNAVKVMGKTRITEIKERKIKPVNLEELDAVEEKIHEAPIVSAPVTHAVAPVMKLSNKTRNVLSVKYDEEIEKVDFRFKSVDPAKIAAFQKEQVEMIKTEIENNSQAGGTGEFKIGGLTFYYEEKDYRS